MAALAPAAFPAQIAPRIRRCSSMVSAIRSAVADPWWRPVVRAPGRAGQHTEYISHDVEVTGREIAAGGPWLDVELPPGTEVTLTLRLRLRVRVPAARTPWDTAPRDAAEEG